MNPEPDETVLVEKAANVRRKFEYAGGKVTVTNRRVLLVPHAINLDSRPAAVLISEITLVEPFAQFGIFPTGVRLTMRDGSQQHFICWGRQQVIDAITQAKG